MMMYWWSIDSRRHMPGRQFGNLSRLSKKMGLADLVAVARRSRRQGKESVMKSMSAVDLSQPKLPPQNVEAEQSVLGAVLLDNSAMAKAMELLVEDNFYRTSHRKIYRAMLELSEVGEVIDQITLTERLKAQGEIEAIGGAAYLAELVQSVASSANIRYHCKIVRDKALLRELIHTSTEVLTRGYEGTSSVDDLLDFAERSVFGIVQGKLDRSFTPLEFHH